MQSKITDKFQTTIPKEIREKLKLKKSDYIDWEISGESIRIRRSENPLLKYQGSIHTGEGDIEKDILRAREKRIRQKYES